MRQSYGIRVEIHDGVPPPSRDEDKVSGPCRCLDKTRVRPRLGVERVGPLREAE